MIECKRILAVVDAERDNQPALSRAYELASKTPFSAIPYGFIWGWLPCGLVYSTLTWSLAAGTAVEGAALMFFFGLGTLPTLLAASAGSQYLIRSFQNTYFRQVIAVIMAIYAAYLICGAII